MRKELDEIKRKIKSGHDLDVDTLVPADVQSVAFGLIAEQESRIAKLELYIDRLAQEIAVVVETATAATSSDKKGWRK